MYDKENVHVHGKSGREQETAVSGTKPDAFMYAKADRKASGEGLGEGYCGTGIGGNKMLYAGIDLGTSAVKLLLMNEKGEIQKIVSKEYPLFFPHPGWSEQNPEDWYTQSMAGLKELLADCDKTQLAGISFGGQMHGLVILDEEDQVIRPAILWNDGRTSEECDYLNQVIGTDKLSGYTANISFTGFTAPKILWVKNKEPENFARIRKIMLPKDYLAYRLGRCMDWFAYDSYRRFIQMFSDVVMEIPKSYFERILDEIKDSKGVNFDTELTADDLKEVIQKFKQVYKDKMGTDFPQEPKVQLMEAVKAVFRSWDNDRAIVYRRMNDIPGDWGTAVNVQAMVFGNMGNTSGTGVAFTRNPSTGAKGIYGEYLINAQGEDVVAGIRTPQPITKLQEDLPECYAKFIEIANKL